MCIVWECRGERERRREREREKVRVKEGVKGEREGEREKEKVRERERESERKLEGEREGREDGGAGRELEGEGGRGRGGVNLLSGNTVEDVALIPVLAAQDLTNIPTTTHTTSQHSALPHYTHTSPPSTPNPLSFLPDCAQSLLSLISRGQAPLGHRPPNTYSTRDQASPPPRPP